MNNLISFDLDSEDGMSAIGAREHFGKVAGFLRAHSFGLPTSRRGFILDDVDEALLSPSFPGETEDLFLCRPDAPIGRGNQLPRGRDIRLREAPDLLREIRRHCPDAILLLFPHPSREILGRYVPRSGTQGAANVLVEAGRQLVLEYVGPGFDAGDLTRGKTAHCTMIIPWALRFEIGKVPPGQLTAQGGQLFQITAEAYDRSRSERVGELVELTRLHPVPDCDIPMEPPRLTPPVIRQIWSSGISALLDRYANPDDGERLGDVFMVIMNFYGDTPYVFEIWRPERSTPLPSGDIAEPQ